MAETTTPAPGNVYTEAQHFSLLESAVERSTSTLTTEKSELETRVQTLEAEKAESAAALSEAQSRIDKLEADKVNAEAAAEAARTELETFKSEIAHQAQIEELKTERKTAVQQANANLTDTYFSTERVTRWAEMSEEQFTAFVADVKDAAKDAPAKDKEADKDDKSKDGDTKTTEQARETAAFTGGETPSASEGSLLGAFLGARRGVLSA